jgi:type IV pilus assembly protein PilA
MREINMNKKGFTLIELLIVVVIIGILAAIAIPRFSQTRERAFVSAMQSDLRNLQTIQEQFYAQPDDTGNPPYNYGADADLIDGDSPPFAASSGVTVTITASTADGWAATAEHSGLSADAPHCAIAVGEAENAINAAASSGQIVCAAGL